MGKFKFEPSKAKKTPPVHLLDKKPEVKEIIKEIITEKTVVEQPIEIHHHKIEQHIQTKDRKVRNYANLLKKIVFQNIEENEKNNVYRYNLINEDITNIHENILSIEKSITELDFNMKQIEKKPSIIEKHKEIQYVMDKRIIILMFILFLINILLNNKYI